MLLGVRDAPLEGLRIEHRPGGPLAGAVLGYRGYRELACVPRDRWETPTGDVILVLGFGDPFLTQERPDIGGPIRFSSFVVGLHERPLQTRYVGLQTGVQVRLAPPAAAKLLGIGMHELANRVVDLADLAGGVGERWRAMVASAGSWRQRFDILDVVFRERMRVGGGQSSLVQRMWEALRRSGGAARVEDLVAEAGCSHRHLAEMFRREVGLTPKRAARVLRYELAAQRLRARQATLAVVAAECGYSDQPHLTREFRGFSGVTPAAVRNGSTGQFSTRP